MTTDVLTAHELAAKMIQKSAEVDQAVAAYKQEALNYAAKKHMSEMAQATAYPSSKGTVNERQAQVTILCSQPMLAELQADALRNGADRALKAHMAQLSALQSLAAALREEVRMARAGPDFGP